MLTKTQAGIMKVFASKINERFSIKQVSETLKKPYPLIHRSIKLLINDGFLLNYFRGAKGYQQYLKSYLVGDLEKIESIILE